MPNSMRPRISHTLPLLLSCLSLASAACGGATDDRPPVATPTVTLGRARVPVGAPLDVTYKFEVAQGAAIDGNYTVFVHFLDSEGERMWGDDHAPVPPTSQWKPGRTIEYSRLIWLPIYPYTGETRVRVGLYSPNGDRLPLNGNETGRREYEVATFTLQPQSENIFLIFKDGWHASESLQDRPDVTWEWTKKAATLAFRNPRQDVIFYLEADGRTDIFSPPQQVAVLVNDQPLHTIAMEREPKLHRLPITAAQLGSADMVELKLQPDRSFTPSLIPAGKPGHSGDNRELGIRVFHAFVGPK